MPDNTDARIATADVLTLLLHNQYALAAVIEEVALWAKASGSSDAHIHTVVAMETTAQGPLTAEVDPPVWIKGGDWVVDRIRVIQCSADLARYLRLVYLQSWDKCIDV
jgi:hypothetical protein